MCAEKLPQASMSALPEEVEVLFSDQHDGKRT